jgi:hypothetical protein
LAAYVACGKLDTGKDFEWKGRPIDDPLIGGDAEERSAAGQGETRELSS